MSGGAFNYKQWHIEEIADSIQSELDSQGKEKSPEELWMSKEYYEQFPESKFEHVYPEEVQKEFRTGIKKLREAYIYAKRIDWLLSGDDGDESFLKRLKEELKQLNNK